MAVNQYPAVPLTHADEREHRRLLADAANKFIGIAELPSVDVADLPSVDVGSGWCVYCPDGDAGSPCLAVFDGSNWKRIVLGATVSTT